MKICEQLKGGRGARVAAASLLLAGLVWTLFGQAGSFDYLNWDDPAYTFTCPFVKDGLSWANVCEAVRRVRHQAIWMPVTSISYMCDISLFGSGPGAHHLVNVAIHALNAVLLLWFLVALGQRASRPLTTAALFLLTAFWALHPQRAEAVAWIASRKELLCATFVLGGLLCWLRARRREGWGGIPALAGTYACFILACMSKPTAMCFPFLVLAVEGLLYGARGARARPSGETGVLPVGGRNGPHAPPLSFVLCHLSVFLLLAAATGALAVYSQKHPEGYSELALYSAPLWWRLLNALVAVGLYVFQMVIPVGIHLDYRAVPEGWPVQGTRGLCMLALVALGAAGAWWWRRRRIRRRAGQDRASDRAGLVLMGAVMLWFFAALGPTLGILGSFGDHARADRFLYLPAMALPIAGAVLWPRFGDGMRVRPWICLAGLAAVVAGFFAVAYPVVASYRTDLTAFTHTLEADPDNWRALAHIGQARCATGVQWQFMGKPQGIGELDAGIDMLRRSHAVKGSDATSVKLVYALMCRGRADDWDEILAVCATFDPAADVSGRALEALGTAELKKRRWTDADRHLRLSISAKDQDRPRYYSRYDAYLKLAYVQHHLACERRRRGEYHDSDRLFEEAERLFTWVRDHSERIGRPDLARRAQGFLSMIELAPHGILPW